MKYYVQEFQENEGVQRTAGVKARDDCEAIFVQLGGRPKPIVGRETAELGAARKMIEYRRAYSQWKEILLSLEEGDELYIQFPLIHHTLFLQKLFRRAEKKGAKIVLLIHDLETLRWIKTANLSALTRLRIYLEETMALQSASYVVAHNKQMIRCLTEMGIPREKLIDLEIFDYLTQDRFTKKDRRITEPVIIAGTLRPHKAGYAYALPPDVRFNLYGVGYEGASDERIRYFGSFPPDDLPAVLDGSFGLVWDGDSAETCSGAYGDYLRINNPHKTSLYLAAGIPVIVWTGSALAEFVRKHECGIAVDSLCELSERIAEMSETEYDSIRRQAEAVGEKLRRGYIKKKALAQIR